MILSRRKFLQLSGLSLAAALLPPSPPDEAPRPVELLGRVTKAIHIYDRPSLTANTIGILLTDTIFNIYASVLSDDEHFNRTWYQIQRGFVYSGLVQPVRWQLQKPVQNVPKDGFLGEVTVPYTISKTGPNANYASVYRLYYSTTYWVTGADQDDAGTLWYRILDERLSHLSWVKAEHLRRVAADELTPISPAVKSKRIEINLEKQTFQCFENDVMVLDTLCATGLYLRNENGKRIYGTPAGDWAINRKRPTRHMAGDDFASADFFDLPGVPWVSYFHWWGISIHGTYWHNDYGRPRSHGCINLTSETAKWVYRWSMPRAPLSQKPVEGEGTQVLVF
jgi:hypothetical protein